MSVVEATGLEAQAPRRRRVGGWVAIAAAMVAITVVTAVLASIGQWTRRDAFDPDSAGPDGTRALVRILADHGVDVTIVRDSEGAEKALASPGDQTLVLADAGILSDDDLTRMSTAAASVIVPDLRAHTARVLFGAAPSGFGADDAVGPSCRLPAARRAGSILPGTLFTGADGDVTGCFPVGETVALLQRSTGSSTVTGVDGTALFTNERLAEHGNAALALNLLGAHPTLIWYIASPADAADQPAPTLGEITPDWVSPAIVLLLLAGLAAALWRGRRFGPLVAERLPVTVRAQETTQGRARLYARSRDAAHAADRLRIGTLRRLSTLLALGTAARAEQIADATADRCGVPRREVRDVLIDRVPHGDRELVTLSDRLRELERLVRAAVRPATGTDGATDAPTSTPDSATTTSFDRNDPSGRTP